MRKVAVLVVSLFMLAIMGGPALASHKHTLNLPQDNTVVAPCEPEPVPGHPIHTGLHTGLNRGPNPVTVTTEAGGCL